MISVTLVVVAGGDVYERYATRLMRSAVEFFHPAKERRFVVLDGETGWPQGTMMRYHRLIEDFPGTNHVFLCDADMLFVAKVGAEILSDGVTATLHPGFVGRDRAELPYEQHNDSAACVGQGSGGTYYCGGFVGGTGAAMEDLAVRIADIVDSDGAWGHVPCWHDESALNKVLSVDEPTLTLSPSYCYPDNDDWYRSIWPEQYERKLVALDKSAAERGGR